VTSIHSPYTRRLCLQSYSYRGIHGICGAAKWDRYAIKTIAFMTITLLLATLLAASFALLDLGWEHKMEFQLHWVVDISLMVTIFAIRALVISRVWIWIKLLSIGIEQMG
jgi:hypothetical protein